MKYSNIINSILSDKILSLEEKFMLISLKNLDKYGDNIVTVGYETLMEYSNTTRRAKISNILKSLKEKKYIEWKRCGRKENEYRFIKDYLITEIGSTIYSKNYSSKNGTLKEDNRYKNETFNINNSSDNEIIENFGCYINGTSSFDRCSEGEISKNNVSSKNETKEVSSNSVNRTFSYDASSKFGTINTIYCDGNGTLAPYYINNKNNIYNNKNINNNTDMWVYKEIFDLWNSKDINKIGELSNKLIEDIRKAITVYGVEKIKSGIENYSKVFHSDYYYNHEWNLSSFLIRPNGISRFLNSGDIWLKYKKQYETISDEYEKHGMNYEDYINL